MSIKVEPCRGCGRLLMIHAVANLSIRLESEPLDAHKATTAVIAGRTLWRATATSVAPARPAELAALAQRGTAEGPYIVQEHRCGGKAASAPLAPSQPVRVESGRLDPHGPSADRTALFSGPRTGSSSVRHAGQHHSEHPCDECSRPVVIDGPELYCAISLGATTVWAVHAECGGGEQA